MHHACTTRLYPAVPTDLTVGDGKALLPTYDNCEVGPFEQGASYSLARLLALAVQLPAAELLSLISSPAVSTCPVSRISWATLYLGNWLFFGRVLRVSN